MSTSAEEITGVGGPLLATYRLSSSVDADLRLHIIQGSVTDFKSSEKSMIGAIVNAANEGCLGGGGVDGAVSAAGGKRLYQDRLALPTMPKKVWCSDERTGKPVQVDVAIRCKTGDAKLTGSITTKDDDDDDGDDDNNKNNYGKLHVPFVIHAVGPHYGEYPRDEYNTANRLLTTAYQKSLTIADDSSNPIEQVAFALLSAGIFRGQLTLKEVLAVGIKAIKDWQRPATITENNKEEGKRLKDIFLFAFNPKEARTLRDVCDDLL